MKAFMASYTERKKCRARHFFRFVGVLPKHIQIQNALENGWKPLTRTLLCLPAMPSALLTPDPPRRLVLAPI